MTTLNYNIDGKKMFFVSWHFGLCKVWTLRQTCRELDLSALSAFCFRRSNTHEKRVFVFKKWSYITVRCFLSTPTKIAVTGIHEILGWFCFNWGAMLLFCCKNVAYLEILKIMTSVDY